MDKFQKKVIEACSSGYSIRAINSDGSVVCEKDDDTNTNLSKSTVQSWASEILTKSHQGCYWTDWAHKSPLEISRTCNNGYYMGYMRGK